MTSPNTMSITTVTLSVAAAGQREPGVTVEVSSSDCRVWDGCCRTACGELFPFKLDRNAPYSRIYGERRLADMPHFIDVFKFVVDQHMANRSNPLGAFLLDAVVAMETSMAEKSGSCVYFARAGSRVKIGWSRQVATRLAQLQTGNAAPIELLGILKGARATERALHERFASARVSGERFEATPELLAYISAACT
jgi:hypothetical protein